MSKFTVIFKGMRQNPPMTVDDVKADLSEYGELSNINIIPNKFLMFVTFDNEECGQRCIEEMNEQLYHSVRVSCCKATKRPRDGDDIVARKRSPRGEYQRGYNQGINDAIKKVQAGIARDFEEWRRYNPPPRED